MKKTTTFTFAHLLLWLVCATLPLGFTACSDDEDPTTEQSAEPEPEPEPDADYTVMLYGCGGGNLMMPSSTTSRKWKATAIRTRCSSPDW